ncbi:non-ribosomal peptide synthetase, partial [Shewanella surugensis]
MSKISKADRSPLLLPLHFAQENVYFDQLISPDSSMYNIGCYSIIEVKYDFTVLKHAWQLLIDKVDALRLDLVQQEGGAPLQRVLPKGTVEGYIESIDFSSKDSSHSEAKQWMQAQFTNVFDAHRGQKYQIALIKLSDKKYYLFYRFHHIINDGTGVCRLIEYLHRTYDALLKRADLGWLVEIPQYQPTIEKSREYIVSKRYHRDKRYWSGFIQSKEATQLDKHYHRQGNDVYEKGLSSTLSCNLRDCCAMRKISLLSLLMGVSALYFSNTLNSKNIIVNVPVHGRKGHQGMRVVGMHSNVIPIELKTFQVFSFIELCAEADKTFKAGVKHGQFPQSHLSRLNRDLLSDITLIYDPHVEDLKFELKYLSARDEHAPLEIRLIDFMETSELILRIDYGCAYFNETEVKKIAETFIQLMEAFLLDPTQNIQHLALISPEDRHTLLHEWNQTEIDYPKDKTLQQLFEEQVAKTPDNIALVFEEKTLTYDELNQSANQFAHHIRSQYQTKYQVSLKPDTLIALYLDRSLEMVISILAVLKAGSAYVPIAPEYPQARTLFMLQDTAASFIITQAHYEVKLSEWLSAGELDCTVLPVDENSVNNNSADNETTIASQSNDNPLPINQSSDLAYVIYTSGTTGQPKGVMIEHAGIANRLHWMQSHALLDSSDVVLQKTPYIFDVSLWELLGPSQVGARLVIAPPSSHTQPEALYSLISQHGVTALDFVPSMLGVFSQSLAASGKVLPVSVRRVFCGGEALTAAQVDCFYQVSARSTRLYHMYGPTEAAIDATFYECQLQNAVVSPPLGRVIDNTQVYVLDTRQYLVPIGTQGELYISGAGLARGYLNRPELTIERFIDNPFASKKEITNGDTCLYKTGDLVRYLSDGNLAYLGRNDSQVKIRGHRIELGEIEAALVSLEGIQQAVVIDRPRVDSQGKYLAAYLTCATTDDEVDVFEQDKLDVDDIRSQLSERLPDYMLPLTFTVID